MAEADVPEVDIGVRDWIRESKRLSLIDSIERQRGRDQMRQSWEERAAIYEEGGRGYWSPDVVSESSYR